MLYMAIFKNLLTFILIMGVGTNWFKRGIGKNAGKYLSNKVFGISGQLQIK